MPCVRKEAAKQLVAKVSNALAPQCLVDVVLTDTQASLVELTFSSLAIFLNKRIEQLLSCGFC